MSEKPELDTKTDDPSKREKCTRIEIKEFREAILRIKANKGYTWGDIGRLVGRAPGQLPGMLGNPRKQYVKSDFANDIFARLSGAHLESTPWQKKQYTAQAHRVQANMRAETLREGKLQARREQIAELKRRIGLAEGQD